MKDIYFIRDHNRGVEGTYRWLKDEVEELGEVMQYTDKKAMEDEFADVLAWSASLANIFEINLGAVALGKYDRCCPKCNASPCECPRLT